MYNIEVVGNTVLVESNRIIFDTEELAMKFVLELLKDTGRIGC